MLKPLEHLLSAHIKAGKHQTDAHRFVAPSLLQAAQETPEEIYPVLSTGPQGLTASEAAERLVEYGPNSLAGDERFGRLKLFYRALLNPLVLLLLLLALISFVTGDPRAGTMMSIMVLLGVGLRFVQESRAGTAAARLKRLIRVTSTVLRDGQPCEIPASELVPGDVVELAAGDMIPADLRLISSKDLHVIQSTLTGESFPVEKHHALCDAARQSPLTVANLCFLGTSVESGAAHGLVIATGKATYLGAMANTMLQPPPPSSFDRGISRFTWVMVRFVAVMVPLVFLINGFARGEWKEAFFFAVAVAVGLTPEMLPMIVSVCLSRGALELSRQQVVVKRLNSMQNLGAMDVLCTDKTGTLTMDRIILEKHCDVALREDDDVLALGYLNSHFQTGLRNVMDRCILEYQHLHSQLRIPECEKVDEIPFDFQRKVMSVVVRLHDGTHRLICKGAPDEVFRRCTDFELDGESHPLDHALIEDLREEYRALGNDGFRVLALAYRDLDPREAYSTTDETALTLKGYIAFLDPPKDSAAAAITALRDRGVTLKVLTGDNELVSRKICREVGVSVERTLLGEEIEGLDDAALAEAAGETTLFARLSPIHKTRIIRSLQARGHVVGFLGDGINDAPALRIADVGISVDTAVDIAKESADAILLEKSLLVLATGVLEGRKVFANILKYVRMGASSNFGNMFSVLGGSLFLPFVPMAPLQILTNNLLYDISQVPIPTDQVDPEQLEKPRPWSMSQIVRFILLIGPISSLFDYATYFLLLTVFDCWRPEQASLFQTGWFVESLLTQTLIIHIIRTNRIPFLQSRASTPLIATTIAVICVGLWIPVSPLGPALGFTPLPGAFWPWLALIIAAYLVVTQGLKMWLLRRHWL